MSETLATITPLLPDRPPVVDVPVFDESVDPALRLHLVERLLEDGELLAAVGQLRAARVVIERRTFASYGVDLPAEWFNGEGFDADLALARMTCKAAE